MADEVKLSDLPNLKSGFVYSISEHEISDVYAVEVLKWKDLILDAGYYKGEDNNKDTGILAIAYRLGGLNKFGIDTPTLQAVGISQPPFLLCISA